MAGSQQGWRSTFNDTIPPNLNYGLYSQIDDSIPVVNTVIQSSVIGVGVGGLSVPPNSFSIGDSFVARIGGVVSNLNNTNITFRLHSLGVSLVDTGLITIKASTNQFWQLVTTFTIRSVGASGVASIASNGSFVHIRNNLSVDYFGFNTINNTTFDTTILNTLDITAQWQTASLNNSIFSDSFVLNKIF
jgi:hypothetical protein